MASVTYDAPSAHQNRCFGATARATLIKDDSLASSQQCALVARVKFSCLPFEVFGHTLDGFRAMIARPKTPSPTTTDYGL